MIKARLALSALVMIAALLSSTSHATTTTAVAARNCTVVIYFTVPANAVDIRAVKLRLARDRQVVAFRFVTRAQALEKLRKKHPALTANIKGNPLPARLHVQLKDGVNGERFVIRFRSLKLRVVDEVTLVKPGPSSCSF